MDPIALYDSVCNECSVQTTKAYSTSFSLGIRALGKPLRLPVYAIYGFVRFADEIVDSFHDHDKKSLFDRFKADTYAAIDEGISLNPILHAFQRVFHRYSIDREHVDLFLRSMEWDLDRNEYDRQGYEDYVVGSAEVVGLMCLRIFVDGNNERYEELLPSARRLGAAFQKINFLRDLSDDFTDKGRTYFPELDMSQFNEATKKSIELEIADDFKSAHEGILKLPKSSRLGVHVAYIYYRRLFEKIQKLPSDRILEHRIRIPNYRKALLLCSSCVKHQLNLL